MKILISLSILFLMITQVFGQTKENSDSLWFMDYEKAIAASQATNLPVMMVFSGSDWCKPCMLLKINVLETDTFKKWALQNVILLKLDFPRLKKNELSPEQVKHNDKIASLYNPSGLFPLIVIIDSNGKKLGALSYKDVSPEEYIRDLKALTDPAK